MELVPVPLPKPLLVLYSNPRTVALAPLILVMLPPRVAPVVEMEVTVELVVTVGAVAAGVPVISSCWMRTPLPLLPFAENLNLLVEVSEVVKFIGPPVMYVEDEGVAEKFDEDQVVPLSVESSTLRESAVPDPYVATLTLTATDEKPDKSILLEVI